MKTRYKYIHFDKSPVNENEWDIWNNRHLEIIGRIEYYKQWKEYIFIGRDDCIFNTDCLTDIIDFIKQLKDAKGKEMKERSIIFNSEMVQAILDGQKTQTRRVIKPQPIKYLIYSEGLKFLFENQGKSHYAVYKWKCPYGQVGDRLWVRETWRIVSVNEKISTAQFYTWQYKNLNVLQPTFKYQQEIAELRKKIILLWAVLVMLMVNGVHQSICLVGLPVSHWRLQKYGLSDYRRLVLRIVY